MCVRVCSQKYRDGFFRCVSVCRWTFSPLAAVILPFRHADSHQPPVSFCSVATGAPGRPAGHRRSRRQYFTATATFASTHLTHSGATHDKKIKKLQTRSACQATLSHKFTTRKRKTGVLKCQTGTHVRAYKNRTHSTLSRVLSQAPDLVSLALSLTRCRRSRSISSGVRCNNKAN